MDAIGEIGDHLHVMLDPDHRHVQFVLDAQDEAREILALRAVEAGRWLVEQHDSGLERKRTGKADDLLDPERQASDGRVAIAFELHQIDDALDRLAMRDFGAAYVRQEQHLGHRIGADARVTAGQQVVEHAHLREQLAVLERAGETEPGNLVRRASGNVLAAETDGAAAAIDAADAVERAGLAGAIRADQRKQLARGNRKRYVVKHGQAAETQAQMSNIELSHTTSATG